MSYGYPQKGDTKGYNGATVVCETCLSMFSGSSPKNGSDAILSGPHHLSRKSLQRSVRDGC